jgi:prepilin-type N-terminal cleavage/methylation domain-containing protein
MGRRRRGSGFSLLEFMIALAVLGVFIGVGGILMSKSLGASRAKSFVRSIADLMMLARTEAIRTGDNHVVFVFKDAADGSLTGPGGAPAAALLIRDVDADGAIDAGEKVAAVAFDKAGGMGWGSTVAANLSTPAKAPNDNPGATFPETDADFLCCTFLTPGGNPSRWVVFLPDGMPRGFETGPLAIGDLTSGNGAVYVTGGGRDYAVVLAPLGGVRVHAFEAAGETWTQ